MVEILDLTPKEERETTRQTLIKLLTDQGEWSELAQYYMSQKEWDEAWRIVSEKLEKARSPVGWGYGYVYPQSLSIELADLSADSHPQQAIAAYTKYAEQLIQHKSRGSYQQAAQYLLKVRKLHAKQKQEAEWTAYITALRERYPTLRALKDELNKAGL